MPKLSKAHRELLHSLAKTHASNRIVKRQVARGVKTGTRMLKNYAKSGAMKRDFGRLIRAGAVTGMGDYHVGRGFRHAKSGGEMGGHHSYKPRIHLEKGEMRIRHSEYIGELISSNTAIATFKDQNYPINPANSSTFPWLSQTAVNFQEYKFKRLTFEFRSLVAEAIGATNITSIGSVIMATQYDSIYGPYTNKATMENSDFSISAKASEHCHMAIECDPKFNPLGVLYTSPNLSLTQGANGSDIRMQNLGIMQVASVGMPTGGNPIDLGELWVHYDVELYKPQLNAGLSALTSAHYIGSNASAGAPTANNLFGTSVSATIQPNAVANNLLPLTFTTNSFSFPLAVTEGNYLCTYYLKTNGAQSAVTIGTPVVTAGSLVKAFWDGTSYQNSVQANAPENGDLAKNFTFSFIVKVDAPGATLCNVNMGVTTGPINATLGWDLIVTPYNSIMA